MSFGDIVYTIVLIVFVYLTFGIIKNYYKSKFDDEGRRLDMIDDEEKEK